MSKILIIGEVLIDLIENQNKFSWSVGGAPFNVAYNLSSLSDEVTFIGQVGNDFFGEKVKKLVSEKFNFHSEIEMLNNKNTTIALNIEDEQGNRNYSFLRNNTADYAFNWEKIEKIDLKKYDLIHFGSLFISDNYSREKMENFVKTCKEANVLISFDVNFRSDIFDSIEIAKNSYRFFIENADILKISNEEIETFFGYKNDFDVVRENLKNKVVVLTKGKSGSLLKINDKFYTQTSFNVRVKDTIGAGDSFYSGFLHKLLKLDLENPNDEEVMKTLEFASACGALTCSTEGAIHGYKIEEDVVSFIENYSKKKRFIFFKY